MRPEWPNPQTDNLTLIRQELARFFAKLGESSASVMLGVQSIDTNETIVPHGQVSAPRWRVYNLGGDARVWQTRKADDRFLYLRASAAVLAGIEVF